MPTVDLLLFGPKLPELRLGSTPGGGATLEARKVYLLDLSARIGDIKEKQQRTPRPLTWRYLWANTKDPEGRLLCLGETAFWRSDELSPAQRLQAWIELMARLIVLCESPPERQFFKKLTDQQRKDRSDDPGSLWEEIAIIPQVWVNFISPHFHDGSELKERARTPFRVDFLMVGYGDNNVVVEIDGHHHYQTPEAAIDTLTKSRHLLRAGWRHFRFHSREVEALTPDELYSEINLFHVPF